MNRRIVVPTQPSERRGRTALAATWDAAASLDALSPLAVLHRGYAIAQREDGRLLRDTKDVSVGDSINVRLAKGRLTAEVTNIEKPS